MKLLRRRSAEFVCEMPKGWDERTRMCVFRPVLGRHESILLTHPNHRPMILDMEGKKLVPLIP